MYDVNPAREDIVKHDLVKQGFPKEMENADLIFWDPPYYKKKKGRIWTSVHIVVIPRRVSSSI